MNRIHSRDSMPITTHTSMICAGFLRTTNVRLTVVRKPTN
jgi:hypothetical protein